MREVIVIGGGASGLMAACAAASMGKRVLLLEKNEKLGKKLFKTAYGQIGQHHKQRDCQHHAEHYGHCGNHAHEVDFALLGKPLFKPASLLVLAVYFR